MRKFTLLLFTLSICIFASAQWTTNISLNTEVSSTNVGDCKTINTSTGKTWMAYFKNVPSPKNYEVRAQLLDKEGTRLLGPEGVLVNDAVHPTFTTIFSVAVDNNNNLIVAFANSSTNTIYVNKIDTTGAQKWNAGGTVFTNGLLPRLAVLNNSDVVVSWLPTTTTKALMQKLSAATGTPVWPVPVVVEPATTTHRTAPANMFVLSNGDFIHLFHNRASSFGTASTLWAQRYNADGVTQWTTPVQLCDKTTAYNREYFPMMHNDTLFIGYPAATGTRTDGFLQRLNPDGSRPWGMNGSDFALDNTYFEFDADMTVAPATNSVWMYSRLTDNTQGMQGTYVQKFNKSTGARQFGDNGKIIYPIVLAPSVIPLGISLFNDNTPVLLLGRYNTAASQFLYASKLDNNGNFAWAGDTVALGRFSALKLRMTITDVIDNQAVVGWVERKGTFDQPFAQPIRIDGATGPFPLIPAFTFDKTFICKDGTVQFTNSSGGYVTGYSWSFPGGNPAGSTSPNPVVTYSTPGVYSATLTISNAGGTNSITKTDAITVSAGPTISAGNNKTITTGDQVTLEGSGPVAVSSIAWTPATGLSNPASYTPTVKPGATTTYTLTVKDNNNCTATASVEITVLPYCVRVMDAFTPNGDGINDRWLVTNGGACTNKVSVVVFNRYGQRVYKNDNYQNDWTGTYNGKPVPDGTYYYRIELGLVGGTTVSVKGNLTILR